MRDLAGTMNESQDRRLRPVFESSDSAVRLYAVLCRVNEAIVRRRVEQELHQDVCRILVEQGGYALAWIGQPQGERVVPIAAFGSSADYVREITVAIDGEFGKGPTGTSIREGTRGGEQGLPGQCAGGPVARLSRGPRLPVLG